MINYFSKSINFRQRDSIIYKFLTKIINLWRKKGTLMIILAFHLFQNQVHLLPVKQRNKISSYLRFQEKVCKLKYKTKEIL
jgi:hypothetical protein